VDQLTAMLKRLAEDGEISVLLIEQNLGVATAVAQRIAVLVNGRVAHETSAALLASDRELQQRFLGVRAVTAEEEQAPEEGMPTAPKEEPVRIYQVRRASQAPFDAKLLADMPRYSAARAPTRWSSAGSASTEAAAAGRTYVEETEQQESMREDTRVVAPAIEIPVRSVAGRNAYVAGTFDTKGRELNFIKTCLEKLGLRAITVDLSTSQR